MHGRRRKAILEIPWVKLVYIPITTEEGVDPFFGGEDISLEAS